MPLITWSDALSVGISSIDKEHRQLVDMINQLHDAMKGGKGNDVVGKILDSLISYTATHFKHEEDLFKAHQYTKGEAHTKEHQDLVKQVLEIQKKFHAGQMGISTETINFLKDWLSRHIQGSDKAYSSHLLSKGVK